MMSFLFQRFDFNLQWLLPLLTALLFIVIGIVPWPLPYWGSITPALVIISIYYWPLYRPDLFRPSSAFLIGLLYDAINNFPFGTSALVFVAIYQLALSQRRFFVGHSFFMLWFGFTLAMLFSLVAYWVILSLWNWQLMPVLSLLLQTLLTISVFPLPAWLLIQIQRKFMTQN